ncbi:pro-opiomelanocortin-like isoform X1 [Nerophis lumbriciformis]|uniref:pro-opiomelanocortin-like isoform X1 n=1 Tax=Nerophis lumbriciformis TaxID=546530 RepID=UPI003BA8CCB7
MRTTMTQLRMCPAWVLVYVVLVGWSRGTVSQCWDQSDCQGSDSASVLVNLNIGHPVCSIDVLNGVCITPRLQLCQADLRDTNNGQLRLPSPPDSSSSLPAKRSYSMEHFRWGKPVGRKRRPVKVYTPNGVEEESSEVFPALMRRDVTNDPLTGAEEEVPVAEEVMEEQVLDGVQKKDGSYKMKHFRWSSPPASKRYGGFMKSWEDGKQRPLVTFLKNVINKDGQMQE